MGFCTVPIVEKKSSRIMAILNIFIPGSGPILAAILLKRKTKKLDGGMIAAGILMFCTSALVVGFIWGISWNIRLFKNSTTDLTIAEIDFRSKKSKDATSSQATPDASAPPIDVENPTNKPQPTPSLTS